MKLTRLLDKEADGRWVAEMPELPGVMTYGATPDEALANVALRLRILSDRIGRDETDSPNDAS